MSKFNIALPDSPECFDDLDRYQRMTARTLAGLTPEQHQHRTRVLRLWASVLETCRKLRGRAGRLHRAFRDNPALFAWDGEREACRQDAYMLAQVVRPYEGLLASSAPFEVERLAKGKGLDDEEAPTPVVVGDVGLDVVERLDRS